MLEKILNTLRSKNTSKRSPHVKKERHNFLGSEQQLLFRKRKKRLIIPYLHTFLEKKHKNNIPYISLAALILILLALGAIFMTPLLHVNQVYIFRKDAIINIDQAYANVEYIREKNILLLNTSELAEKLQKSQKSISSIEIDLSLPNTVTIELGSHPAIFQTEQHLVLTNGVVISKDSKEYLDIPQLHVSKNIEDYAIFWNTLNTGDIKNIQLILSKSKKNILGFSPLQKKYYITERELILINDIGTLFIFDLDNNIEKQIEKLAIYQKEKENINEKRYIYIDLRIPEKLFLCPLESEFNCRENLKRIYSQNIFQSLTTGLSQSQQ